MPTWTKSRKWRMMASQSCHFLGSLLKEMLVIASHTLASFLTPADEMTAGAIADVAPPVSVFLTTITDAEAECFCEATVATAEPAKCATAATPETAAVIPFGSPVNT
jgi:hypothetical protein